MSDPKTDGSLRLVHVSPGCMAFVSAALGAVFGAIGLVVSFVLSIDTIGRERAFDDTLELLCPVPMGSAVGGFFLGLIGSWVFNALAQSVGGLPVRLERRAARGRGGAEATEPMDDDPLAPRPGTANEMPCPECGEPVRADRTFCPECGYDFDAPAD